MGKSATPNKFVSAMQEVERSLSSLPVHAAKNPKFNLQHYIGTRYSVLGITTKQARDRFRKGYRFSRLPLSEQYPLWKYIWQHSRQFDALSQALYFLEIYAAQCDRDWLRKELIQWLEQIDNWAHSDMLTHHFAALHETSPSTMYPVLQTWNRDPNPWKRRQSVLSLLDYARFRKKYPAFGRIVQLITPLLHDPDIYVQKGIGWSLRECHLVYPEKTLEYITNKHAQLSSIAFTSATEKYKQKEKEKLKALRKRSRNNELSKHFKT